MELEVTAKKENKALQRKELEFQLKNAKVTPSRKELRPKIAAMLNTKEELTVISKIAHSFGKREAIVKAEVYESKQALEKNAAKHLTNRDLGIKKEKKEEKPAAKQKEGEKEGEKKPAVQAEKGEGETPAEPKSGKEPGKEVEKKPEPEKGTAENPEAGEEKPQEGKK